jgi:hypothetical protein
MLELRDGTTLVLDRSTELVLDADEPRRARLRHGGLVADVEHTEGTRALFEVPLGSAEVIGTKFSLRAFDDFVRLEVSRGSVRLSNVSEQSVTVHAGESGELRPNEPPSASAIAALDDALGWSEYAFGSDSDEKMAAPGLGELVAKKPGDEKERKEAVVLSDHSVKVRIVGNVARTEIEEVFQNGTDDVLEGIYRFPLPPDAKIERLALDVDGKLEDGAFVDRDRAAKIWRGAIVNATNKPPPPREEIIWVPGPWKDPALLEWQRGGRFELRVYPIPKRGSRRIVIAYTQTIAPAGDTRRYVYPLPHDPGGTTKVGRFSVDVELRGRDPRFGVRPVGYELDRAQAADGDGVARLSMNASDFTPSGDLALEYALPNRDSALTAWTYSAQDGATTTLPTDSGESAGGYVALALRPKLPRWTENRSRTFALVVDSSRSMIGERYHRAAELAARIVREMDRHDQVTVLACDTTCREKPGGVDGPGSRTAADVRSFLTSITPEGGSDVAEAVRQAAEAARRGGDRSVRVVYIGDGTPTVGAIEPGFIRREVERSLPAESGTVSAVALGADADRSALEAVVAAGGGVVLSYAPGQRASDVAYAVLGATYGTALRDATVELPAGLEEVLPRRLPTLVAGGETIVVARMRDPKVSGSVRLKGRVGSQPFEATYPVELEVTAAKGNAFVPRLFAAAKIADLEGYSDSESREKAVRLSQQYHVASRHTSLLVLESPAMFRAFGLDNSPKADLWTGEDDSVASAEYEETSATGDDLSNPWEQEAFGDGFGAGSSAKSKSSAGVGRLGGTGSAGPAPTSARRSPTAPKKPSPRRSESPAAPSWPGAVSESKDEFARRDNRPLDLDFPESSAPIAAPEPVIPPPRRRMIQMRKVW